MTVGNQIIEKNSVLKKEILDQIGAINYSVFGYEIDKDGWSNLDEEVAISFKRISLASMGMNTISFISFADTELIAEKIDQWEVEPDKGKFFYSMCDDGRTIGIDEDIVNKYYFFKSVLSKTMKDGTDVEKKLLGNPKSAQLAYILAEPFIYRIKCSTKNPPKLQLFYDTANKLLTVSVPSKWLEFNSNSSKIYDEVKEIEYYPVKYDNGHCVYETRNDGEKVDIADFISAHANIPKLRKIISIVSKMLYDQKVPIKDKSIYRDGFARLILSLAYLAKLNDCCVESIPGVVAEKNRGKDIRCLGVFIWGYKGEVSPYTDYFKLFADKLCVCFAAKYIEPLKYVDKIRMASINSAIAEIMSRNMSHNLGSHYLYYTKTQLSKLANKVCDKGPEIRGVARVLGYIQARMDYLATIVSREMYPYGGVFLKGQVFDELTIDDFSRRHYDDHNKNKRTTNYFLQNIVLSENFTRESINNDDINDPKKKIVRLQVILPNKKKFTGIGKDEYNEKLDFSKICVALPGGVMSVHAFFNVVENLIRNSAKYKKEDLKDELVFTILVNDTNLGETNNTFPGYEFVIYDNKENAMSNIANSTMTLLSFMNKQLMELKVLDKNNVLEKSNKGIKEMIFSVLWMRAYTYSNQKSYAEILADIDDPRLRGNDRFNKIREYAFEYVAVGDNRDVYYYDRKDMPDKANLGIRFYLPEFRMMEVIGEQELQKIHEKRRLNNFSDIICVYEHSDQLRKMFTRVYIDDRHLVSKETENNILNSTKALKSVLNRRFGNIDAYKLKIGGKEEEGFPDVGLDRKKYGIYFKSHLGNNWKEDVNRMKKYGYCESISGGDFTKTIESLLDVGMDDHGFFDGFESYYFGLKIKESALTRITLIDERFYNDMVSGDHKREMLGYKNIRILNLRSEVPIKRRGVDALFIGNHFHQDKKNYTHFLSIHLGMIEKIVEDDAWSNAFGIQNDQNRAVALIQKLREMFGGKEGEVFISVHSGRGNFSKELEQSLKNYPFINVSAIENVLNNSKYLLAQLFYNQVYKG